MSRIFFVATVVLLLVGCAAPRPMVYPNQYYIRVGDAQAQRDIADCMWMADQYIRENPAADVAQSTLIGGGAGAAIGAVGGAISGSAGKGAAIGAATGATAGLLGGLLGSSQPSEVYKNYVDRCLAEKGYEPMGWR